MRQGAMWEDMQELSVAGRRAAEIWAVEFR